MRAEYSRIEVAGISAVRPDCFLKPLTFALVHGRHPVSHDSRHRIYATSSLSHFGRLQSSFFDMAPDLVQDAAVRDTV
jgi:hypothetical protein